MKRETSIKRKTNETDIELYLCIDGCGKTGINTGIGFLDHMLNLTAKHGFMDMELKCRGDLHVDNHHTVEDIGIVFGKAFKECLGDKNGITRYSTVFMPMDDALSMASIDISGRPHLTFNAAFKREYAGNFETELIAEFFRAFVNNAGVTLHINLLYGENTHHIVESIFKGFGKALDESTKVQERINGVLSTKGIL